MRGVTAIPSAAAGASLSQFLVRCPTCDRLAAVHVDEDGNDGPVIVRAICVEDCTPALGAFVELLTARYNVGALPATAGSSADA